MGSMRGLARWFGPKSPLGPEGGGLMFVFVVALGAAIVLPPIFWLMGFWWRLWL